MFGGCEVEPLFTIQQWLTMPVHSSRIIGTGCDNMHQYLTGEHVSMESFKGPVVSRSQSLWHFTFLQDKLFSTNY